MTLLLRRPWIGPLLALCVLYGLFCFLAPDTFPGSINLLTMARQTVVVAIAAVGMTYVILLGGIDLRLQPGDLVAQQQASLLQSANGEVVTSRAFSSFATRASSFWSKPVPVCPTYFRRPSS